MGRGHLFRAKWGKGEAKGRGNFLESNAWLSVRSRAIGNHFEKEEEFDLAFDCPLRIASHI